MGSSPYTSLISWHGQRSVEVDKSGGNRAEKSDKKAKSNGQRSAEVEKSGGDRAEKSDKKAKSNGQRSAEVEKSGGNRAEKSDNKAKSTGGMISAENKRTKSAGDVKSAKTKRANSADDKKSAVANNKAPTPNGVHYILFQQRTKGVETFAIATARLQQRVSRVQGWVCCQSKSLAHPLDPLRRRSAVVLKDHNKRQANETRMQKEAMARVDAEQKLVSYMEKMIAKVYEDINREVGRQTKKRNTLAQEKARSLEKQLSVK